MTEKIHRSTSTETTPQKKKKFLIRFAEHGNKTQACREAGCDRGSVYDWINNDPAFAAAFEDAKVQANDNIETEIHRRGVLGWDEPVFYQGALCATIRKYSDTLLIFLAKANNPKKFRDNTTDTPPAPIDDPKKMTMAQLAAILRRDAEIQEKPEAPTE